MKQITAALKVALKSRSVRYGLLVEIDHPAGMTRVWTGVGPLQWDSKIWKGIGTIGMVSGISSSGQIAIQTVDLTISAARKEDIDVFLEGEIKGREAKVWWVAITTEGAVVPDPMLQAVIGLDTRRYKVDDDGNVILQLTGHLGLWQLERPLNIAWSSEEQKRIYPEDTGFDDIPSIVNQKITWTQT